MGRSFALPATLGSLRNYVDGEFVETGRTFDNVSPIDGSVLAKVHEADAALVDRAVRAARRALDEGPWGRTRVEQRAEALHRVADIIARRFDEFLQAEVADTGRPVEQARKLAAKPLSSLITTKQLMKGAQQEAVLRRMDEEGAHFRRMLGEPAAREAMTAFMEKRKPDFSAC